MNVLRASGMPCGSSYGRCCLIHVFIWLSQTSRTYLATSSFSGLSLRHFQTDKRLMPPSWPLHSPSLLPSQAPRKLLVLFAPQICSLMFVAFTFSHRPTYSFVDPGTQNSPFSCSPKAPRKSLRDSLRIVRIFAQKSFR